MKVFRIFFLGWFLIFCLPVQAQIQVTNLLTEFLKCPVGIDSKQPRLSWQISDSERKSRQSAYEIRVAKDSPIFSGNYLVWKSGKILSTESLHHVYAGEPLQSGEKYFWQVRVWDYICRPSMWSSVSSWQMGLLNPDDWKAKWIGLDVNYTEPADDRRRLPARMVRCEISMEKTIKSATVFLCGLGFSELYLNGSKVDNRIMDPTHSYYKERVMYVTHDVTRFIQRR